MKIKVLQQFYVFSTNKLYQKDDVVDLDKEMAMRVIKKGLAIEIKETKEAVKKASTTKKKTQKEDK